jgi:hypothetical protein
MNIEELTIGQARELARIFGGGSVAPPQPQHPATGKYVIVRAYAAGVHAGIMVGMVGNSIHLRESRRIWNWTAGALSCSELAMTGPKSGKFSVQVPDQFVLDPIEIIPTTPEAEKCIRSI